MVTEIHATGKNVNDAVEALKAKLCVDSLDEIEWKLVHTEKKGFLFGIGAQPAEVVAFVETPDPVEEKKPEVKAEAKKPEVKAAPKTEQKKAPEKKSEKKTEPKKAPEKKAEKPKKPKTPTTDAEVKAAFSFVETLVKNLELNVTASVTSDEENGSAITIAGDDAGMLIGHHGETLDAVQYLANLAANRAEGKDDHERIVVDVEGYREKREETLRALARRMAAKVQKYGKSVMLEPMNPYERRIIHSEIQQIEGISTNSIGSDENRKVVIFLTEKGMGRLPQRDGRSTNNRRGSHNRRRPHGDKPTASEATAETAVETTEE
ncbi:MAG: KH domain-containing protein [Clostridia bacterium]|nr:KH domain-containing protein [Clostridia bacterium]